MAVMLFSYFDRTEQEKINEDFVEQMEIYYDTSLVNQVI